ncbi:putative yir3 protein [Plasmodium yoelii yoelii]|uniref:Yir3 protein n=1 Tax=Plasmodium yoelii yoelii TaxID=73239 RepID=Q7RDV3_PLAYO|nr:putative yir3 protein [Plasmodium yoelii yoelii]
MNKNVCEKFTNVTTNLKYDSSNERYKFINDEDFKEYCTDDSCDNDLDKINAGCLYLFDAFFKDISAFSMTVKGNINIVDYILIWLSYMLNLGKSKDHNNINEFYNTYMMYGDDYTNNIDYISDFNGYKDLIDKSYHILSMEISIISRLYDAFNALSSKFVQKYEEFNTQHTITKDKPYFHALIILLNGYDYLKNKCEKFPSTPELTIHISEQSSEVTSSISSIASKLIPILSILVAIAIFLGISYKKMNH